jgi:hypothetical protein
VTRDGLREHGAWWVEALAALFGKDARRNSVVVKARAVYGTLASWLPGAGSGAGSAASPGSGSGSAAGTRPDQAHSGSSRAAADGAARAADLGGPDSAAVVRMPSGRGTLRFEKRGSGIIVPVRLRGPTRELSAKMLFDTGATLTTITETALRKLGLFSSPSDPTIITRTANGRVRRALTVIDGVSLGKVARVSGGVTVVICEPCGSGEVVGLLGLNVSRHFRVTLDHDAGEMTLEPKSPDPGHLFDIRPFVRFAGLRGFSRGPKMTISATLENRSPRALAGVRVEAKITGGRTKATLWTAVSHVPPRGKVPLKIEGLLPQGAGHTYHLSLKRAAW